MIKCVLHAGNVPGIPPSNVVTFFFKCDYNSGQVLVPWSLLLCGFGCRVKFWLGITRRKRNLSQQLIPVECNSFLLMPVVWIRKICHYTSLHSSGMCVFMRKICLGMTSVWRLAPILWLIHLLRVVCLCAVVVASVPDESMYVALTFLSPCCNLQWAGVWNIGL